MTKEVDFRKKTLALIDGLKSVCANYGLGNDGNEFKIITQAFLYKFLNDKFIYEVKKIDKKLAKAEDIGEALKKYKPKEYEMLLMQLSESTARLTRDQFVSTLFQRQNETKFAEIFDNTLLDIAKENSDIFSVLSEGGEKLVLFENISGKYITEKRDEFCRAIINKLIDFSFENIFHEKFDFFADIFEYLIKDYNSNSGGTYAEYFTPHAVAKIMAQCLVPEKVKNVTCYDPSAGSGTLLMNLAHQIGENKCTIYSQDISQKSSNLLRLNLILNNLVHSIPNIVKGNTLLDPYHKHKKTGKLQKFDFIVSNPPFKLDFSGYSKDLHSKENNERFFAGIPKVPNKDAKKMAIYLAFLQHIVYSLSDRGKAAIVVPSGFNTAQTEIERKIREKLVHDKMLRGVISMPSNIFATTNTNVSILFLDKANINGEIVLIDASKLGETIKIDDSNEKTVLRSHEEELIIKTFNDHSAIDDFSVVVNYDQIKEKKYSFSAGQYFEIKIKHAEISDKDYAMKIDQFKAEIDEMFNESKKLETQIKKDLSNLVYE
jgi:type I restriction enzyme M protein